VLRDVLVECFFGLLLGDFVLLDLFLVVDVCVLGEYFDFLFFLCAFSLEGDLSP